MHRKFKRCIVRQQRSLDFVMLKTQKAYGSWPPPHARLNLRQGLCGRLVFVLCARSARICILRTGTCAVWSAVAFTNLSVIWPAFLFGVRCNTYKKHTHLSSV